MDGFVFKRDAPLFLAGVRAASDVRDNYSPGWKFNHWEQKVCSWRAWAVAHVKMLTWTCFD